MKRDFRVCLNNRGFSTFLFKAQLMQCIELESILIDGANLNLAAGLTFRGHEAGLFLLYE